VAIDFLRTQTRTVLPLGRSAGQPHSAQLGEGEMSARSLLRTQNQVAGATELTDGSQLRDPGCPGSHPGAGCPQYLQGLSFYRTLLFPGGPGIRNQFSALTCYCRLGPREPSRAAEERWAARGVNSTACGHGLSRDHRRVKVPPGMAVLALRAIGTPPCKLPVLIAKAYPHAENIWFWMTPRYFSTLF